MFLTNIVLINFFILIASNINIIQKNIYINRLTQNFIYFFLITFTCLNAYYFNTSHDIVVFESKYGNKFIKSEYGLSGFIDIYFNLIGSLSIISFYNFIEYELLWKILNIIFKYLNFNFNTFYLLTIVFLFLSFNYFCNIFFKDKKQKVIIKLIFFCFPPFLDMIYIHMQSSVALSFFFIFLSFIIKKRLFLAVFFYLLSISIHYSMVIFLPLIFINQIRIIHLIVLVLIFYIIFLILFSGDLVNSYNQIKNMFYGGKQDNRIHAYHLYLIIFPPIIISLIYLFNFKNLSVFFSEHRIKILVAILILLSSTLLIIGENRIYIARINDFNKIILLLLFVSYIYKFLSIKNIFISVNTFLLLNGIYLYFF